MPTASDVRFEATLTVLIQHLVLCFPHATIFSRQVRDAYHVFVIAPYGGGPEKTVQVERAWLADHPTTMDAFRQVLKSLNLPAILQMCDRYNLRSPPGRTPANDEWPSASIGGTVWYGPLNLSGASLSTSSPALFAVCAD